MTNNIVVNGRFLSRRISGVERVTHEISKRLTSSRIIHPPKNIGRISGNLWEQIVLPARKKSNEILWSPANAGPWVIKDQVVTIHDASVFDHPGWFRPAFAAWTRLSWRILAKQSKAIITVSDFSKGRLKIHLGIPDKKINVIHNGVGRPFGAQTQTSIKLVKEKYNLNKPYFLFVGTNEPRKNLTTLLEAWQSLNISSCNLFIAGGHGKVFSKSNITAPMAYIPDEDLPALYAGAMAYITTSLYEGFGLPALEAIACGTPVIAPNTTAFPEILGDTALLVNPQDTFEISTAIMKILDDAYLRDTLRECGIQLTKKFSWDESARKTQSLLESLQ